MSWVFNAGYVFFVAGNFGLNKAKAAVTETKTSKNFLRPKWF